MMMRSVVQALGLAVLLVVGGAIAILLGAGFLARACSPAHAFEAPQPTAKDANARVIAYDEDNPVLLTVDVNKTTTITFGQGERVKDMTFGMPDGPAAGPCTQNCPQGQSAATLLHNAPIWGKKAGTTDLTIITILPNDFTERVYKYILKVKDWPDGNGPDPEATYWLRYTYTPGELAEARVQGSVATPSPSPAAADPPDPPRETPRQRQARERREAEEDAMRNNVTTNRRYVYMVLIGDSSIAPYDVFDNTRLAGFRFHPNTTMPTAYIVDTPPHCDVHKPPPEAYLKAAERTAPTYVRDDMLVIQETDQHYRFRLGAKVLDLFNCGYDPVGLPLTASR